MTYIWTHIIKTIVGPSRVLLLLPANKFSKVTDQAAMVASALSALVSYLGRRTE